LALFLCRLRVLWDRVRIVCMNRVDMESPVTFFTVVHRKLGTDDDSSTDAEVLDRVLMHYPETDDGEKVTPTLWH